MSALILCGLDFPAIKIICENRPNQRYQRSRKNFFMNAGGYNFHNQVRWAYSSQIFKFF
jgi:hypothetical protein